MGFNCFQTSWIIVQLVLLLNIKLIQAEWYSRFKVLERNSEDPKAGFESAEELVKLCPTVEASVEEFTERTDYKDECSRFLRCTTSDSSNTGNQHLFVSVETCERCHKNDKDSCPNGLFIYSKELQRCVPPKTLSPKDHKCGTNLKTGKEKICSGPENTKDLHRLGKSAFYIYHNENKKTWVNWKDAKDVCTTAGLKLAMINNLQTEVLIGRQLEKFIRVRGWIDNWYWIDAKFDRAKKKYIWQDKNEPVNFTNFHYRSPRPKGYGDFFDNEGNFIKEPEIEYCLAQSMPLPFPKTYRRKGLVPYGMRTGWWEKECESKKKGNVLCESMDAACGEARERSIYTESTGNYYKGFWPMSNRRFVVIWTAKSFEEANTLCKDQGLKMYSPNKDDTCLPQNLKNWMKTVTSYSFWTDVKYDTETRKFFTPDKKEVDNEIRNISLNIQKREVQNVATNIKETCVSYTWNYEEFPINKNFCNCTSNVLALTPENCKNKIGVICQHPDDKERKCTTEFYEKAIPMGELLNAKKTAQHPKILEYYEFNADPKWQGGIFRSAYKGSSGECPNNWVRVTEKDTYWGTVDDYDKSNYKYDFLTPYWMKSKNGTCTLSKVTYDPEENTLARELSDEDCSRWLGFVLCRTKI